MNAVLWLPWQRYDELQRLSYNEPDDKSQDENE
jgi:hypothetical protein